MNQLKLLFYFVFLLLFSFMSCKDDDESDLQASYLNLSESNVEASSSGENLLRQVDVSSDGNWLVDSPQKDWYTVSPLKGNGDGSLQIQFTKNETEDTRLDTLRIYAGDIEKTLLITQYSGDNFIISADTLTYSSQGGAKSLRIITNQTWEIGECPTWLTFPDSLKSGTGDKEIVFTASPNKTDDKLSGEITIISKEIVRKVIVKQYTMNDSLKIDRDYYLSTKNKSERKLQITTGGGDWHIENVPDWITASPMEGSGDAVVMFTILENTTDTERDVTLKIVQDEDVEEVYINQWTESVGTVVGRGLGDLWLVVGEVNKEPSIKKLIVKGRLKDGNSNGPGHGSEMFQDVRQFVEIPQLDILDMSEAELIDVFPRRWFLNSTLKEIKLPKYNGITLHRPFYNAKKLKSVSIPEGYTGFYRSLDEGVGAFHGCESLEIIHLPSTLIDFDNGTFSGCVSLKNINIPEGVDYISRKMFEGCTSLETITLPQSIESIGTSAFKESGIRNIVLSSRLQVISDSAFLNTPLEEINLPAGIREIGISAFSHTLLKEINLPDGLKEIGAYAFWETELTSVVIPNSVTEIGKGAFYDTPLKDVKLSEGLTEIGDMVFRGTALRDVDALLVNKNIKSIGVYAFCGTLAQALTIPSHIEIVDREAFRGCENLKKLTLEGMATIKGGVFMECPLEEVYVKSTIPPHAEGLRDYPTFSVWDTCKLYVPKGSSEAYKAHAIWGKFKNIVEE